jgi:predicted O-methyltransferase YrrM
MIDTAMATDARARCDAVYDARPGWVEGTVSLQDARYLFARTMAHRSGAIVEVGTASGVSTAVMCAALEMANAAGLTAEMPRLFTYDISPNFYADPARATGDAARAMLPPDLVEHITFRSPVTAADLIQDHPHDTIGLLFLDANHQHPWPTLDLLAALDHLRPGAEVVLHDVNLPLRRADFPTWGAKQLFDGLEVDKQLNLDDPEIPNIGSCFVPTDKGRLREQLLGILYAHEWECDVDPQEAAVFLDPQPEADLVVAARGAAHESPNDAEVRSS